MLDLLVVGGDSVIGEAVLSLARGRGLTCAGTSRRRAGGIHFNLAKPDAYALPDARRVLLAAAISGRECETNPADAAEANVIGTTALIRSLADRQSRILFLSTSQVFDGTHPLRREEDPTNPLTEYGRQKVAGEAATLALAEDGAVLRLGKVFSHRTPIVEGWKSRIENGLPITAFSDMTCAPTSLAFTATAVLAVLLGRGSGIYHASSDHGVSWYDIACHGARTLGVATDLVVAGNAAEQLGKEHIAPQTALGTRRLSNEFSLVPPSWMNVISSAFTQDSDCPVVS